jgi:valyl-tRNA synthetase
MKRFDARKAVVKALKERGLFKEVKDTETFLPVCSRSKDVIEPLLKSQWYVNCKDMAARAVQAARDKTLKIIPEFHEQVWFRWLEDCHDWCISRQLWWGHRIPAYHITVKGQEEKSRDDSDPHYWVSAQSEEEAMQKALQRFPGTKRADITLNHDEDVLDTWFSSGIFPFSICGWPENTSDLSKYYPGTLLETGHDILFFWVARMIMMGLELTDKLPFEYVYLHAIIRDAHGRKMSKSLGNIIDPLDVISGTTLESLNKQLELYNLDPKELEKARQGQREDYPTGIPECGTDALRFALCAYTAQGRDINLDVLRIQGYRHFCNKLWNATRFAMINGLGSDFKPQESLAYLTSQSANLRGMDKWILSRISETVSICNSSLKNFELTNATTALFNFWLYDLCDYYIEYLKPTFYAKDLNEEQKQQFQNSREILYTCLDVGLRLISPFMPFVSEELYQRLPRRRSETDAPSICVTPYPQPEDYDSFRSVDLENTVKLNQEAINKIRSLRSDYQLTPKVKTDLYVQYFDKSILSSLEQFSDLIMTMSQSKSVQFLDGQDASQTLPVGCALSTLSDKCKLYILLKGIIDIEKEEQKLTKKREDLNKQIEIIKKDMQKPNYDTRVPEAVRQKNQEKVNYLLFIENVLKTKTKNMLF